MVQEKISHTMPKAKLMMPTIQIKKRKEKPDPLRNSRIKLKIPLSLK